MYYTGPEIVKKLLFFDNLLQAPRIYDAQDLQEGICWAATAAHVRPHRPSDTRLRSRALNIAISNFLVAFSGYYFDFIDSLHNGPALKTAQGR